MEKIPISKQIKSLEYVCRPMRITFSYLFGEETRCGYLEGLKLNEICLEATGEDWDTLKSYHAYTIPMADALSIVIHYEQMKENKEEARNIINTSNLHPVIQEIFEPYIKK